MRTFQKSISVFVILLSMSASLMAFSPTNKPSESPNDQLRKEIIKLIDEPNLGNIYEEELEIAFMLTKSKEVVVLSVDTDNSYLEDYIKRNLNYQEIETQGVQTGLTYRVKVTYKK